MKLDRAAVYTVPGLWIRRAYKEEFLNQSITAVVRPGDRSDPIKAKGVYLPQGVDLPVRFIERPGNREAGTGPQLYPDDGTTIRVTWYIVKRIGDLTTDDLCGTAPDTATPELVRYHLATIYNIPLPNNDDIVTIWRFEYQPNVLEKQI